MKKQFRTFRRLFILSFLIGLGLMMPSFTANAEQENCLTFPSEGSGHLFDVDYHGSGNREKTIGEATEIGFPVTLNIPTGCTSAVFFATYATNLFVTSNDYGITDTDEVETFGITTKVGDRDQRVGFHPKKLSWLGQAQRVTIVVQSPLFSKEQIFGVANNEMYIAAYTLPEEGECKAEMFGVEVSSEGNFVLGYAENGFIPIVVFSASSLLNPQDEKTTRLHWTGFWLEDMRAPTSVASTSNDDLLKVIVVNGAERQKVHLYAEYSAQDFVKIEPVNLAHNRYVALGDDVWLDIAPLQSEWQSIEVIRVSGGDFFSARGNMQIAPCSVL